VKIEGKKGKFLFPIWSIVEFFKK